MAGDWIKLHRKLTESAVFKDSETLHVWIYILTHANWKDAQLLDGTWLRAGELITSRDRIAKVCKMSPHKAYRRVHALKNLGQIDVKTHNKGTHIKVLNWGTYQHDAQPSAQQAHSQRTASAQQARTEEERNKERTLFNSVLPQPKHTQNKARTKAAYTVEFEAFWDVWPRRRRNNKRRAFKEWQRAKQRSPVATNMEAAERYANSEKGRGEYCQMPSTWLHGDGWEDDPASLHDKSAPLEYKPPTRTAVDEQASVLFREFADCRRQLAGAAQGTNEHSVLQARLARLREQMG